MKFVLMAAALFLLMGASSCGRQKEDLFRKVDADVWLHEQIPPELCALDPKFQDLGIYRKVNCTKAAREAGLCQQGEKTYEEFIPYCDAAVAKYIGMHKDRFKSWVDVAREKIDECF